MRTDNRHTDKEGKKHRDYILTKVIRRRCETRHRWEQSGHKITERQTQEVKQDTTHWEKNYKVKQETLKLKL